MLELIKSIGTMILEDLLNKYRWQILTFLAGLVLISLGIFLFQNNFLASNVEILEKNQVLGETPQEVVVEIGGSVNKPAVYHMPQSSRVEDLLQIAGGLSQKADQDWVIKNINRAAKLIDGQKIYIPSTDEIQARQSKEESVTNQGEYSGNSININMASQKELESLSGIGPVTAQNIIDHRPYSKVEDLLVLKILKQNVYDKNKDYLTVY
jgi:competence protein ComEA